MKKRFLLVSMLMALVVLATGCSGQKEDVNKIFETEDGVVKYLSEDYDFKNIKYLESEKEAIEEIDQAILSHFNYSEDDVHDIWYYYNFMDLNDDGEDEIIVFTLGPKISGLGGSPILIFNPDYSLNSEIEIGNVPLLVLEEKTGDYRDLLVGVETEFGQENYYVILSYNGNGYDGNLEKAKRPTKGSSFSGTALISNELTNENRLDIK